MCINVLSYYHYYNNFLKRQSNKVIILGCDTATNLICFQFIDNGRFSTVVKPNTDNIGLFLWYSSAHPKRYNSCLIYTYGWSTGGLPLSDGEHRHLGVGYPEDHALLGACSSAGVMVKGGTPDQKILGIVPKCRHLCQML